jgi:hypothetical protein
VRLGSLEREVADRFTFSASFGKTIPSSFTFCHDICQRPPPEEPVTHLPSHSLLGLGHVLPDLKFLLRREEESWDERCSHVALQLLPLHHKHSDPRLSMTSERAREEGEGGDLSDQDVGPDESLEVDRVGAVLHHDVRQAEGREVDEESSDECHGFPSEEATAVEKEPPALGTMSKAKRGRGEGGGGGSTVLVKEGKSLQDPPMEPIRLQFQEADYESRGLPSRLHFQESLRGVKSAGLRQDAEIGQS